LTDKTYLLIGHVTEDLLPEGGFVVGGTVTYAAVVAKHLGWRLVVVTAAAADFNPPACLDGVDWTILPSDKTTTFKNLYTAEGRRQVVGPVARAIMANDIPAVLRRAAVVHLCPVAQELEPSLARLFPDSLLVATPQGWMRRWGTDGVVSLDNWRGAGEILPQLDAVVLSVEDIQGDWEVAERWAKQIAVLVVTQGEKGCTLFHRGEKRLFPARRARVIDPTGAGDVFAAAFFIYWAETGDPGQAAVFANMTASIALQRPGPGGVPSRIEVEQYVDLLPS
jgi:sugar/nucleoside kinase (ribokinase family)